MPMNITCVASSITQYGGEGKQSLHPFLPIHVARGAQIPPGASGRSRRGGVERGYVPVTGSTGTAVIYVARIFSWNDILPSNGRLSNTASVLGANNKPVGRFTPTCRIRITRAFRIGCGRDPDKTSRRTCPALQQDGSGGDSFFPYLQMRHLQLQNFYSLKIS